MCGDFAEANRQHTTAQNPKRIQSDDAYRPRKSPGGGGVAKEEGACVIPKVSSMVKTSLL